MTGRRDRVNGNHSGIVNRKDRVAIREETLQIGEQPRIFKEPGSQACRPFGEGSRNPANIGI